MSQAERERSPISHRHFQLVRLVLPILGRLVWEMGPLRQEISCLTEKDFEEIGKEFPEIVELGRLFKGISPKPTIYEVFVAVGKIERRQRLVAEELAARRLPPLARKVADLGLSRVEQAKARERRSTNDFHSRVFDEAYRAGAERTFESFMRQGPKVNLTPGAKEAWQARRVSVLEFVLEKLDRGERVCVLDVATGAGKVPLGLVKAIPIDKRLNLRVYATDLSGKRFPFGWDTEAFARIHPSLVFRAGVDAKEIPGELLTCADLIMINGLFDTANEPFFQHKVLWRALSGMKEGAFCMISPCSMPPFLDVYGGQDFGIREEDVDSNEGWGSPAFAISEILNRSGMFHAETYLFRSLFPPRGFDPFPMVPTEASFLKRLKDLIKEGKVNIKASGIVFPLQENALVVQKLERVKGVLRLPGPSVPQIFRSDLPL